MSLRTDLLKSAISQIGVAEPYGDDRYIEWYNKECGTHFVGTDSWCAMFVSWNARQAQISTVLVPNYYSCTTGMNYFKKMGTWREPVQYVPHPGDIIIFHYKTGNHTGIIEFVDINGVHTIEGNTGNAVKRKLHARTASYILGYACWDGADKATKESKCMTKSEAKEIVKVKAKLSDATIQYIADDYRWGDEAIIKLAEALK